LALRPNDPDAARALLVGLGAPPHLLRHVELVGEAADLLLSGVEPLGLSLDASFVRVGVVLHDVGKTLHPEELERSGADHEPAGEALLLRHGVSPEIARVCVSHARWTDLVVSLEELLIALADKLWKGVRVPSLEERVVQRVAASLSRDVWDVFIQLDDLFERIARDGTDRLERSRA
jgi:hypothetical protein